MANLNFKNINGFKIESGICKIPLTKKENNFYFKMKDGKELDLKKLQDLLRELKVGFNFVNNEFQFFEKKIKEAYTNKKLTFSDLIFENDEKKENITVKVLKIVKKNDVRYCIKKDGQEILFEKVKKTLNENEVDFWIANEDNCRFYEKDMKKT